MQLNSVQPSQSCFCLWRHDLQTESLRSLIGDSSRCERVDNSTSIWVELRRRRHIDTSPTQLNSTRVELSCVALNGPLRPELSWVQLSSVELCRYKHPFRPPFENAGTLRDGDVLLFICLSVRLFVRLSPVKFVKSFATCQHLVASGAYRTLVMSTCGRLSWLPVTLIVRDLEHIH